MSEYRPPRLFRNAHVSTITPNLLRRVGGIDYVRQTFKTPDNDFFDVDFSKIGSKKAIIEVHGLEGSSRSTYMLGLARLSNELGYDAVALNHRGCSGRPNQQFSSYHSGFTADLTQLIKELNDYDEIVIVGYSLGGNVVLKYCGEQGENLDPRIKAVIAVSVTLDLAGSADELGKLHNSLYLIRFLRQLKQKALNKHRVFPEMGMDSRKVKKARNFREFDDAYTAPFNGFGDAENYYKQATALNVLDKIKIPSLIINAKNDSFLTPGSFPEFIYDLKHFKMLTPELGGHVGFAQDTRMKHRFWHEERIAEFLASIN